MAAPATAERLAALLAHAVQASPYYREALGGRAGLELADFPSLPKPTLMAEFDRIVTDPRVRRADLERHLTGPDPGGRHLGEYRVFATSGSSGVPGIMLHTEAEFQEWVAAHAPVFEHIGIAPSTRLAAIGAPSPIHLSKQLFACLRPTAGTMPRVSVTTPLPQLAAELDRFQPEAMIGYASIIAMLAAEQLDGRLQVAPRTIAVSAEVLTAEMEQRIVEAWDVRPHQIYATTEAPIIAAGDPGGTGMRILSDRAVIEVVDEQGRPVPAGAPGHRVLLTNLVNRVLPLIRYELTDSIRLLPGRDRIAAIDGRSDDVVHVAAPGGGTAAVHPHALRAPFAAMPSVRQYQIVHRDGAFEVLVVPAPAAAADTCRVVRDALVAALARAGAAAPEVHVRRVGEIPREPGHAAKLRLVVSA